MDLTLTPELAAFREEVRAFLKAHASEHEAGVPADPKAWQQTLIAHGYAARTIPKAYGGYGAEPDILKSRIIAEEFIAANAPRGMAGQGISMLVPTLLEVGSEEQKRTWIPPTLRGDIIWCQGYSEPGAGSDLANLQTKAVEDGEDFIISGQKIWTSTAAQAQMMFCLVRTEPDAPKHEGISYILFPMSTPGIEVRPLKTMTGHAEFNEVFFTDVVIPDSQRLGAEGEGWKVALTTLMNERLAVGIATGVLGVDALMKLARSADLDGEPALQNGAVREKIANFHVESEGLKYTRFRMWTALSRGETPGPQSSINKVVSAKQMQDLATFAMELMGEAGLMSSDVPGDGAFQQQWLGAAGFRIAGGTDEILRNIIAERVLGLPQDVRVDKDTTFRELEAARAKG
jgi:alkylation response protein AidB-like acyl-CoA dehydrogenase